MTWLSREWAKRAALPSHVVTMLDNFPTNLHPMSQLSAAVTALNSESKFARAYAEGIHRAKYWEVRGELLPRRCFGGGFWVRGVRGARSHPAGASLCTRTPWT